MSLVPFPSRKRPRPSSSLIEAGTSLLSHFNFSVPPYPDTEPEEEDIIVDEPFVPPPPPPMSAPPPMESTPRTYTKMSVKQVYKAVKSSLQPYYAEYKGLDKKMRPAWCASQIRDVTESHIKGALYPMSKFYYWCIKKASLLSIFQINPNLLRLKIRFLRKWKAKKSYRTLAKVSFSRRYTGRRRSRFRRRSYSRSYRRRPRRFRSFYRRRFRSYRR